MTYHQRGHHTRGARRTQQLPLCCKGLTLLPSLRADACDVEVSHAMAKLWAPGTTAPWPASEQPTGPELLLAPSTENQGTRPWAWSRASRTWLHSRTNCRGFLKFRNETKPPRFWFSKFGVGPRHRILNKAQGQCQCPAQLGNLWSEEPEKLPGRWSILKLITSTKSLMPFTARCSRVPEFKTWTSLRGG